jgi:hypothetical protein
MRSSSSRWCRSGARSAASAALASALVVACAAPKTGAKSPRSAASATGPAAESDAPAGYAPPPPPSTSADASKAAPARPDAPGGGGAPGGSAATSRAAALRGASSDLEASQRELDVAAGDCRNACRALGSMDRSAGRICEIVRSEPDPRDLQRCDEAKERVYSARARVKSTCGGCPGGPSVERDAPVPSSPP